MLVRDSAETFVQTKCAQFKQQVNHIFHIKSHHRQVFVIIPLVKVIIKTGSSLKYRLWLHQITFPNCFDMLLVLALVCFVGVEARMAFEPLPKDVGKVYLLKEDPIQLGIQGPKLQNFFRLLYLVGTHV